MTDALARQEGALERTPLGQNFIITRDDLQAPCALARASLAQDKCGNPSSADGRGTITDPGQTDVPLEIANG